VRRDASLAQVERGGVRDVTTPATLGPLDLGLDGFQPFRDLPGCECAAAKWAQRVEDIWADPAWVVQAFHPPRQTTDGQFLSLGLYSYGGQLGGITLRAGGSRNVSARDSVFIPAVADDAVPAASA
jgi:hypothetical protein